MIRLADGERFPSPSAGRLPPPLPEPLDPRFFQGRDSR
jgi:hypothetical protein